MPSASLLSAVLLAAVAVTALADDFQQWMKLHRKTYANQAEENYRHMIYSTNMITASRLQRMNPHARFGASPFADRTETEFKLYHNLNFSGYEHKPTMTEVSSGTGSTIDWRAKGAVTGVKNQGQCGSCWSFSTTGNIEGQWAIAGNPLTSLSEQEFVSCDTVDQGCNGGLPSDAYQWVISNRGGVIVTEASYPYVSGGGSAPSCNPSQGTFGAIIDGWTALAGNETVMSSWLFKNGPISIGVDASTFQTYTGGILTQCTFNSLDHGVLLVGFDLTNNPPYWIIKNSWGASWGESGYIRVGYGTNQCGLTTTPTSAHAGKLGPTPAPTPAPTSTSSYSVSVCADGFCALCQSGTYTPGQCAPAPFNGGQSFSGVCVAGSSEIEVTSYSEANCQGTTTTSIVGTDQCAQDGQYYFKFSC